MQGEAGTSGLTFLLRDLALVLISKELQRHSLKIIWPAFYLHLDLLGKVQVWLFMLIRFQRSEIKVGKRWTTFARGSETKIPSKQLPPCLCLPTNNPVLWVPVAAPTAWMTRCSPAAANLLK